MEYDILNMDEELEDFGGQNQIVNTQEQNREVNPGGLTQTDREDALYGKDEEEGIEQEKNTETEKEKEPSKQKEKEPGTRKRKVQVYS